MKVELSSHNHEIAFQERCLGFPKRAYFLKSVEMVTRGEPLKKETQFWKCQDPKTEGPNGEANGATVVSWHDLSNANEMGGAKASVGHQG